MAATNDKKITVDDRIKALMTEEEAFVSKYLEHSSVLVPGMYADPDTREFYEYVGKYLFRTKKGINWMLSVDYRNPFQFKAMVSQAPFSRWGPKNFKLAMDIAQKHYDFMEGNIEPDVHYFLNYQNGYTKLAHYLTDGTGEKYEFDGERQRPCSKAEVAELRRVWNTEVRARFPEVTDFDGACLAMCGQTPDLVRGFMTQMRITKEPVQVKPAKRQ